MKNSRKHLIFESIYYSEHPVTLQQLAAKLQLSDRTIRQTIKEMNEEKNTTGFDIFLKRGQGYLVKIEDQTRVQNYRKAVADAATMAFTTVEERAEAINYFLIQAADYLMIDELAEKLYVSRTTITNTLEKAKELLHENQLALFSQPGKGLKIIGTEKKKREYLVTFFTTTKHHYFDFVEEAGYERNELANRVIHNLKKHHLSMTDENIQNVADHLYIMLERIQKGYSFDVENYQPSQEYLGFIQDLLTEITAYSHVMFPQADQNFLAIFIQGNLDPKELKDQKKQEIREKVDQFLALIFQHYQFDLREDEQLRMDLIAHMQGLFYRLEQQLRIRNPLKNQVKQNYPLAFEVTLDAVQALLGNTFTVTDEEVAYLALHVGAALERNYDIQYAQEKSCLIVCGSGKSTAIMLKSLITKYVGSIYVTKVLSKQAYEELAEVREDVVLTTVKISEKNKPVFFIQTLPTKDELKKTEQTLLKVVNEYEMNFFTFFKATTFFSGEFQGTKEQLLEQRIQNLYQEGIVSDPLDFYASVMEREALGTTAIGSGIAIPHPMKLKTVKSRIDVVLLKEPFDWGDGEKVSVLFLLALSKSDYQEVLSVYDYILEIVRLNKAEKLLAATDFTQFIEISKEIIGDMQ